MEVTVVGVATVVLEATGVVDVVQVMEVVDSAMEQDQLLMDLGRILTKDAVSLTWDPKHLALLIVLLMGNRQTMKLRRCL